MLLKHGVNISGGVPPRDFDTLTAWPAKASKLIIRPQIQTGLETHGCVSVLNITVKRQIVDSVINSFYPDRVSTGLHNLPAPH